MGLATGFSGGFVAWAVGLSAIGVPPQSPQPLPRSALPVELVAAAVDAAVPAKSTCLVRCTYPEQRRSTSLLRTGENACDVAEITEILQDAVVIRNLLTNRLELLTFARTGASPGAEIPAKTPPPPEPPVLTKSPNQVTVQLPKNSVDVYLSNLPDFLNSALATPRYRDGGTIEGFEINRIKEGSIVEQLGLRNGDVILEVNGDKLDSLASVVRLVGQAQAMAQVKMTVLRNGQKMTFVFNTK